MIKAIWLTITCIVLSVAGIAQRKTVIGVLKDSLTDFSIPVGTVTNITTNTVAKADTKGFFAIQVAPNDLLFAASKSYRNDTLHYSYLFADTIKIYLTPAGSILPNVIVTSKYTKYQLDSLERRDDFDKLLGNRMPTLSSNHPSGFGLTFNLDKVFKKRYQNQGQKIKRFNTTEKTAYVNYRFSPHFVAYYTRLKGEALSKFLSRYTPGYDWLRNHTDNEEVILYINDKLKEFRKTSQ